MALYLCKLDKTSLTPAGHPKLSVCLGAISKRVDGYRFIPWTAHRKPSRQSHKTPEDSIPQWAKNHEDAELLDEAAFNAARVTAVTENP